MYRKICSILFCMAMLTGCLRQHAYKFPMDVRNLPPAQIGSCHAHDDLPDSGCTPGATNSEVTQENIQSTICTRRYTTGIRPPGSYTNPLKERQIQEYGYQDTNLSDYEEDHFISLEIGGSPTDPKNLWPEAYAPKPGAHEKDQVENYLHRQVCSGAMTLAEAQHTITGNWLEVYKRIEH